MGNWQELTDPASALYGFAPDAVLFCFDARHLTRGMNAALSVAEADRQHDAAREEVLACWRLAKERFRCAVLHQTAMQLLPAVMGNNEHRLAGSPRHALRALNAELRAAADAEGVDILALDERAAQEGYAAWHDPALWMRSKQEITPLAAPVYGDLVVRLLASRQGLSRKCLVLDLDNTIWGGVVGDDGMEGLILGQGNALGEGFAAVQSYAKELSRRGVILAVCSKNDEANAWEPFDRHPEMILQRSDVACFMANWRDKAANLRDIAADLNIGLDSLVFLDDNPAEREAVRRELPMVAVPEPPEDPALVPYCLADAGYFEGVALTDEDRGRTREYQSNRARAELAASSTDMVGYWRSLEMQMLWRPFDRIGLQRVVQLINKTNQFNLTTKRYSEDEVLAVMADPSAFGLQLRLLDKFGDNGTIAIVIGKMQQDEVFLGTWLMSCRVLGRQVEAATLKLVVENARRMGARRLIGEYRLSSKNGMVKNHYEKLGFTTLSVSETGDSKAMLELHEYEPRDVYMEINEG